MSNSLVSVIIPAYNAEKYIEETIQSVLKQTHSNFELIVVDDGSTDNTIKLAELTSKNNSEITVIKQKNSGVSIARNTGFQASKGNYVAFLDADDVWLPDCLELMLKRFSNDESLGLVQCDYQKIDESSKKEEEIYSFEKEGYILEELLLGGNGKHIWGICGVLVKREVIEKVGAFDKDLSNGADHEFYFRVAKQYKIGRVPSVTWYYRHHSSNMHSNMNVLVKDTLTAYLKADEHKLFKNPAFRRRCYSNIYLILAGSWWKNGGSKIKGIRYILKAIITYPPNILMLFKKFL